MAPPILICLKHPTHGTIDEQRSSSVNDHLCPTTVGGSVKIKLPAEISPDALTKRFNSGEDDI